MNTKTLLKHIIKTFLLCALIMCPAPTAWYFDTITVLPGTVRDIIGFFGGIMWISLYSLPHVFNAIVLRSAVKKAKEGGKTALILPAIPLAFGAAACVLTGLRALELSSVGWFLYALIFVLFYSLSLFAELFITKSKMGEAVKESAFVLLFYLLHFIAVPFITESLSRISGDPYGIGYAISLFSTVPLLFIVTGIYMGIKKCKLFFVPLIGSALFIVSSAMVQGRSFQIEIGGEMMLLAAAYAVLCFIPHILLCFRKHKNFRKQ